MTSAPVMTTLFLDIGWAARLKELYRLELLAVSNESRELNGNRIRALEQGRIVDAFVSSCFVGVRKPDIGIYRMALDIAKVAPRKAVSIENAPLFVVAEDLRTRSILHEDVTSRVSELARFGLACEG